MGSKSGTPKTWTSIGAARFAREARIATVTHLRDHPIARQWHANKLYRAFRVHAASVGDEAFAQALLLGGLGYDPPYPRDLASATGLVLRDQADRLAAADLYVLSPEMCDVLVAAALSLSIEDLSLLDPDDVPAPSGLVVLPHPLLITSVGGNVCDDRAYSWHTPARVSVPAPRGVIHRPALHIANYQDTHGPVRPESFLEFEAAARRAGTPLPPLTLDAQRCVLFHPNTDERSQQAITDMRDAAQRVDGAARDAAASRGADENRVEEREGTYRHGDPIEDVDDQFSLKFLYAFFRLCESQLMQVDQAPAGHQATVISQRANVSPEVRVVNMRPASRPAAPSEGTGGRDWQHRWVVRMHRVRQWYPSEQRHKVIYRGPYIKGPDDKPLLGGDVVRAVVR